MWALADCAVFTSRSSSSLGFMLKATVGWELRILGGALYSL